MALQKSHASIILAIAILGASAVVFGLLTANQRISSTGNIKGIGVSVYKDGSFSQKISLIDWGYLNPGETKNFTVYIRNEGNVNVTLSMATQNWNPASASSYMTLTWNRSGYRLIKGASVQATLTLSVSQNISGITSFNFDVVITGTESA